MKCLFQAMTGCSLLFLFTGFVPLLSAQTNSEALIPTQRIELFNGKDLSGWTFVSSGTNRDPASIWTVQNGVMACLGKPNGYARTIQTYREYQVHAEWRFPAAAGNSGLFVHLNPPDKVWPRCYEAQLLSGRAGELRLNGGAIISGLANPNLGSLPPQHPGSEKPLGEWNACDIICRSNSITIRINGVVQNEVSGLDSMSGAIALQAEGKPVEFRNLCVEPLPKPGRLPPPL